MQNEKPVILIVDDALSNLMILSALLSGDYTVISKESADAALEYLNQKLPDMILLDIMMPGTGGFELCRILKGREDTREIPVIFVSSLNDADTIEHGFSLGAVDYISKPYHFSEILARVHLHIKLRAIQKNLESSAGELSDLLQRTNSVIQTVGEGIFGLNSSGRITFANDKSAELLGYTREELLHPDFDLHSSIHHTDLTGAVLSHKSCPIQAAVRGEEFPGFVRNDIFFRRDLSSIPVEYSISLINTGNHSSREIIIVFRDISERYRNEERQREAAAVFEVSSEGIVITDAEGRIKRVNPAFTEITGYTSEEVTGQNPRIFKSGRQTEEFYNQMWIRLRSTGRWESEIWNRRKDGSVFPVWQAITAVRNSAGDITGYVSQFSDITRRKLTEEEIRYRGNYDVLTGLVNRALLMERIEQAVYDHRRKNLRFAFMFMDLDRFKQINDTMGHSTGDQLLKQAALRIKGEIRETDTAARIGGDEFAVIINEIPGQPSVERTANRILKAVAEPFIIGEREIKISSSIGIALFPDDGATRELLLRNADIAMYRSKAGGRNQFQFFTESMEKEYLERNRLESDLRGASGRNELELYYQPICSLGSLKPVGFEALLRWKHPHFGMIPPNRFIPIAEDAGLIRDIGRWTAEQAVRQAAVWNSEGKNIYISVNVSPHQIPDHLSAAWLLSILKNYQVSPESLVLEITESVFLGNAEEAAEWMHSLRNAGIRIYLDDFGTGYSSLSYLKRFPVDAVKIDREFIKEMSAESSDFTLVRAVTAMSRGLGLKTVAEGIETEEHLKMLQSIDCDFGQGYYFSRPVPADEAGRLS